LAGYLALGLVVLGLVFAFALYYYCILDPHEARMQFPAVYNFLLHKWYFDELYSAVLVRPGLVVANWARNFDLNVIDGFVNFLAQIGVWLAWVSGLFDRYVVDGLANLLASVSYGIGGWLRRFQTGYLRNYVLFLVLGAVSIWVILSFLMGTPAPATPQ
jgi:NADH-quinone oxidoreductase subunit L